MIHRNAPDNKGAEVVEKATNMELTPRQKEYIELLCDDLPDKQIADKMGITTRTARKYNEDIKERLGIIGSRVGIVIWAFKNNMI